MSLIYPNVVNFVSQVPFPSTNYSSKSTKRYRTKNNYECSIFKHNSSRVLWALLGKNMSLCLDFFNLIFAFNVSRLGIFVQVISPATVVLGISIRLHVA